MRRGKDLPLALAGRVKFASVFALVGTHTFLPRCRNRMYQTVSPLAFSLFQGILALNKDIRIPSRFFELEWVQNGYI